VLYRGGECVGGATIAAPGRTLFEEEEEEEEEGGGVWNR
jgi:hypothetical protein